MKLLRFFTVRIKMFVLFMMLAVVSIISPAFAAGTLQVVYTPRDEKQD